MVGIEIARHPKSPKFSDKITVHEITQNEANPITNIKEPEISDFAKNLSPLIQDKEKDLFALVSKNNALKSSLRQNANEILMLLNQKQALIIKNKKLRSSYNSKNQNREAVEIIGNLSGYDTRQTRELIVRLSIV